MASCILQRPLMDQRVLESSTITSLAYALEKEGITAFHFDFVGNRSEWDFNENGYKGPNLLEAIDALQPPAREYSKPLLMPICGKLDNGALRNGSKVLVLPSGDIAIVRSLERDSLPCTIARAGYSVAVSLQDAMNSEEGNDSLDNFVRQAVGKQPLFSFSRTEDSPTQWVQLLHRFDQPDLTIWHLLTPMKSQMQKCDKCAREFCLPRGIGLVLFLFPEFTYERLEAMNLLFLIPFLKYICVIYQEHQ
ncbi:release factor [Artemisia annua]|uniref:Release factor n=1 Tax=Artemisia annua TaxID=35608 RepID=A0A2U1KFF7_ARTAN|nr:release factor [Artemisia annua]